MAATLLQGMVEQGMNYEMAKKQVRGCGPMEAFRFHALVFGGDGVFPLLSDLAFLSSFLFLFHFLFSVGVREISFPSLPPSFLPGLALYRASSSGSTIRTQTFMRAMPRTSPPSLPPSPHF